MQSVQAVIAKVQLDWHGESHETPLRFLPEWAHEELCDHTIMIPAILYGRLKRLETYLKEAAKKQKLPWEMGVLECDIKNCLNHMLPPRKTLDLRIEIDGPDLEVATLKAQIQAAVSEVVVRQMLQRPELIFDKVSGPSLIVYDPTTQASTDTQIPVTPEIEAIITAKGRCFRKIPDECLLQRVRDAQNRPQASGDQDTRQTPGDAQGG